MKFMKEKKVKEGVHVLYKQVGETPHEAILRYKKENMEDNPEFDFLAMTYAGRLDPMAEGILLVLSDNELYNKEKYLDLEKEYEFEVLWGFETDTLDLLGLVVKNSLKNNSPEIDEIEKKLKESFGKFEQTYPLYSSRPVGGKSLFEWAREGKSHEIQIPKHEVDVFEAKYVERKFISKEELEEEIKRKVGLVKGDFRQKETLEKWHEVLSKIEENKFAVDKINIKVSSGFYVRQFVSDLANSFGTVALAFSIKRTKIGDYC